jgi:Peptidase M50B-like
MFGGKDGKNDNRPTSRGALLGAVAVSVIVGSFVPFGGTLLYPFTLLATWVHEMGHGLTALAGGGGFDHLEIFGDASGLAHTRNAAGTMDAVVCLGGLVAPPILGSIILATARGPRRAQSLLIGLAIALLVSLVIWVRSAAGFVAVPLVAAVILGFVRYGSPRERMFLAQFLGLRLALDTMGRGMDYLFSESATVNGVKSASDIARVAEGFGGPRFLWSVVVSALCIALVGAGLFAAWRRHRVV